MIGSYERQVKGVVHTMRRPLLHVGASSGSKSRRGQEEAEGGGGAGTSCQAREERALVSLLAGVCLYVHDANQPCGLLVNNMGCRQSILTRSSSLVTVQDTGP